MTAPILLAALAAGYFLFGGGRKQQQQPGTDDRGTDLPEQPPVQPQEPAYTPPPASPPAQSFKGMATVSAQKANLRSGPGTSNAVLATLDKGDKVTIWQKQGSWYEVTTLRGKGWMSSSVLQVTSENGGGSFWDTLTSALTPAMPAAGLPFLGLIKPQLRDAFGKRVQEIAAELGVPATHLMYIMHFETAGTMSAAKPNGLGYYGLIQFGPSTAKDLKTTTTALRNMDELQQLEYVRRHFLMWQKVYGRFKNFADLYLAVLWPKGITYGSSTPIPMPPQAKDLYNPDGTITKNSIKRAFEQRYKTKL